MFLAEVPAKADGRYPDSQVFRTFHDQAYSIAEQPYTGLPACKAGRMCVPLGSPDGRCEAFRLKLALALHAHVG